MACPLRRSATLAAAFTAVALIAPAGISAAAGVPEAAASLVADPASLVNPFVGTAGGGNTFPGTDAPFGMVQWSPDTTSRPPGGGYSYNDSAITGFSLTHLSGPGCDAAGDVPILPTTGATAAATTDSFSHSGESADAGYYSVMLGDGIKTELTATARTGMAALTFPAAGTPTLIFKLSGSQNGDSAATFSAVSSTEVTGSVTSTNFCGTKTSYTLHFDMVFDHPFTTSGTYSSAAVQPGARQLTVRATGTPAPPAAVSPAVPEAPDHPQYHGPLPATRYGQAAAPDLSGPAGAYISFAGAAGQVVQAKTGISYVSAAGAAANLAAENPGWDFAATHAAAHGAWNSLLGKIRVSGGSEQQQVLYTALYHALLHPNVFSDASGQYLGTDGRVHTVDAGHAAEYTNFSGWDIYRTQAQLEALIDPAAASDTAQSMVDDYAQDRMLPKWAENNGETYLMAGDPADAILADYYAFGATGFDTATALQDMIKQATIAGNIRPGLGYLNSPGYLPPDGSYGCCNYYGPVSATLEYDAADFAVSAFAGALGDTADRGSFATRAQNWQNLLNPGSGFMQPRTTNGAWSAGFSPTSETGFIEGDSWQYTPMVPFNIAGLAAAMGGQPALAGYLGHVLAEVNGSRTSPYAAMSNEPSFELPWEYDYTGQPYQTQQAVREVQDQLYTDAPGGLAGNDDLGTMSAWYAWSALGMYPMTPGTADLALGSPVFTQAVITLPSGGTLTIDGNGAVGSAPYVQSATWNGTAWDNAYAPPGAITGGGTLSFTLGTSANTGWASSATAAPPSYGGTPAPSGTGPITSSLSGSSAAPCADDHGSSTTNGNPIGIWSCNATAAQQWTPAADGTIRVLGKCLDVSRSGTANGTHVDLYACNGSGAQRWAARPDGALVNPESGKCLDDPGYQTANGTQLDIWGCVNQANEKWKMPHTAPVTATGPALSLVSPYPCIDDHQSSTANGNPVDVWTCNGTAAQQLTIGADGTIHALGKCVDVYGRGTANGTKIDLYDCTGSANQQWQVRAGNQLVNPASGRCLDDPGWNTANGTRLDIWDCLGSANEQWRLP